MEKKNNDSYWLKSGLINIGQNLSSVFLSFASFFILVRMLDKNDFGTWGIFMQTVTVLEVLRNGLIQNAMIRFISSSDKAEHSKIISASFSISTSLTILCILLNLIFAGVFSTMLNAPGLAPLFYLFNIVFLFSGLLTQFNCIEQANLTYTGVFASGFIRQFILFAYLFVCYFLNIKIDMLSIVYVQIIAVILSLAVSWYYIKEFYSFSLNFSKNWIKKIFHYGKFSFGTSVSSILAGTIDQWMLAALLSPAASGTFNIAGRIVNLIDIPTQAVATIVFPQSAKRMETEGRESIKYLYEKSVGTIMAILIPAIVFIYIFDNIIITLLAGEKYSDVVPILNVTLLYCLLIPYGRQFGSILDSIGKTRLTFVIVVITASLNLILNFYFIKRFGVIGAAYATFISNVIGFGISQAILYRELRVNVLNTFIYAYMFYPEFLNKYILKKNR
ncbi:MAG: flippase [Pyrinomonadaceae bacterium]|nr:flippase [Sphingobacteriaceae bacterium]